MNPLPSNGNMTWHDAALVAFILALSTVAVVYLPTHNYDIIFNDPMRALFDLCALLFATWIVNFVALTGLNIYAQRAQQKTATPQP